MQTQAILVNEWQLGDALGQAIQTDRRSDFGLMLAMLSQDVRLHGEFQLPKPDEKPSKDLREQFQLPEPEPMLGEYQQPQRSVKIADAFQKSDLVQSRLQHCLKPDALSYQGSHPHGVQQALENCPPNVADFEKAKSVQPPKTWPLGQLLAAQRLQSSAIAAVA